MSSKRSCVASSPVKQKILFYLRASSKMFSLNCSYYSRSWRICISDYLSSSQSALVKTREMDLFISSNFSDASRHLRLVSICLSFSGSEVTSQGTRTRMCFDLVLFRNAPHQATLKQALQSMFHGSQGPVPQLNLLPKSKGAGIQTYDKPSQLSLDYFSACTMSSDRPCSLKAYEMDYRFSQSQIYRVGSPQSPMPLVNLTPFKY